MNEIDNEWNLILSLTCLRVCRSNILSCYWVAQPDPRYIAGRANRPRIVGDRAPAGVSPSPACLASQRWRHDHPSTFLDRSSGTPAPARDCPCVYVCPASAGRSQWTRAATRPGCFPGNSWSLRRSSGWSDAPTLRYWTVRAADQRSYPQPLRLEVEKRIN